jgi:hypothetical protein
MAEIKMARAYPHIQSQAGNTPSGKWIWDIPSPYAPLEG